MNFYQFHIGDYIKQTVHLTPMEDICYRRLIDMYYETEQPIPTETDRVSRRLRLDTELVDSVLKEFFTLTEHGWENARCNKEIDTYHIKADTARSNGKLGGRPKKTNPVSVGNLSESGSKANQEPRTINHEPIKKDKSENLTTTPDGVSDVVFKDFLKVRKAKRAPLTETAMEGIRREVAKAGLTLEAGLKICIERNWQSFKAEWLANQANIKTFPVPQQPVRPRRELTND